MDLAAHHCEGGQGERELGTVTGRGDYWYIKDLMSVFPSFYVESEGVLGRVVRGAGDEDDAD